MDNALRLQHLANAPNTLWHPPPPATNLLVSHSAKVATLLSVKFPPR